MSELKYLDLKEFREIGFLQEVNRLFFHPRGLALEVTVVEETGEVRLSGIRDYRDDPEGCVFANIPMEQALGRAMNVAREYARHRQPRRDQFGWIVQPVNQLDTKPFEQHIAEEEAKEIEIQQFLREAGIRVSYNVPLDKE